MQMEGWYIFQAEHLQTIILPCFLSALPQSGGNILVLAMNKHAFSIQAFISQGKKKSRRGVRRHVAIFQSQTELVYNMQHYPDQALPFLNPAETSSLNQTDITDQSTATLQSRAGQS